MSHQGNVHDAHLTERFPSIGTLETYKSIIEFHMKEKKTLGEILRILDDHYKFTPSAYDFSHTLCKWGFFREYADIAPMHLTRIVINLAQEMANNMSWKEALDTCIWYSSPPGAYISMLLKQNRNPLAIILLSRAMLECGQHRKIPYQSAFWEGAASNLISELPKQPDRKVCMTCGERVDGVIYCSEQCRPSASLEWYSHRFNRSETQTLTEGFRTARSRFISPSADSCATYDTTQFAPPPYGLVDANPPTPKFVPTKEEPQEEGGREELTLYSGPEKEPA